MLRELDLKAFAGMSMRYMIQNPKMEWQREAGHLQIKPEIALAQKDEIAIVIDPERLRPIDADLQIPDYRKFKNHTGWEPQISFEQTMHDLLNYWRARVRKGEAFLIR